MLSVSVDSVFVHKMWNEHELSKMIKKDIPFPMLSDQDGNIQGFEVLTPSVGRNVSESIRQIKAFQLVRNSGGTEATSSGWKPGKKVLKPGLDLVGNIWKVCDVSEAFDD